MILFDDMRLNQGEFGRIMGNELEVLKRRTPLGPVTPRRVLGRGQTGGTVTSGKIPVLFRAGSWGEHLGMR